MDNWTIMSPHARLIFSEAVGSPGFHTELAKIAGVKNKGGIWHVPMNALSVVNDWAKTCEASVEAAAWATEPSPSTTWEVIEDHLRCRGEVQSWVLDGFMTPYQREALVFGWNLAGVHFWHPTGAGKSLTGVLASLSVDGPTIIITRAASRIQYAREIERFVKARAYVVRPESHSGAVTVKGETWNQFRAKHKGSGHSTKAMGQMWKEHQEKHGVDKPKGLKEYIHECYEAGHRPFLVVGWESLGDHLDALCALKPGTVVFDESHRGKGSKRFDTIHLPALPDDAQEAAEIIKKQTKEAKAKDAFIKETDDGRIMFVPVMNTASAAATLARAAKKRVCTTATPVKDRVRDLWAQLDLAEPNAWGSATSWMDRYCDRKPGVYGGFDTTGSSNLVELNARIKGVAHILSYHETHRQLPSKRRQSVYIAPEDQCAPSAGFAAEMRAAKARGPTAVLECRLAQAGSSKRKAVIDMILDHAGSKHKVVVFTGRKRDCDDLGDEVRKAVKGKNCDVWSAHGDLSVAARQQIIDTYMAHAGPCVLVGTGHAFGESLNIHDTDAAFFVMLPYTPGQLRQWEGRFTRLGQRRPVVIYYVIAEGSVDEHIADILINKLPAVEDIAKDVELAEAKDVLAGFDPNQTEEEFAASILADLDED